MTVEITKPKMELPDKPSEVDARLTSATLGIIGPPGIGKSELLNSEKTLYLQTEQGLNHLACMKIYLKSWQDFEEVYSLLVQKAKSGSYPYEIVVIDTIDNFVKLADEQTVQICRSKFPDKAKQINSLFDYPASSDKGNPSWGWRRDLVMNALEKLAGLPSAVAFIGHMDVRDIKTPTQVIHRQTVSIGGQLGTDLVSWPDHFLNIEANEVGGKKVRKIRTLPTNTVDAKSRGGMIPDGLELENATKFTRDEMTEVAKRNFTRIRSLFK